MEEQYRGTAFIYLQLVPVESVRPTFGRHGAGECCFVARS